MATAVKTTTTGIRRNMIEYFIGSSGPRHHANGQNRRILRAVTVVPAARPFRRTLATSDHWLARGTRSIVRGVREFGLPVPRVVWRAALSTFLTIRSVYYWCFRVFIAEPLFKAYCQSIRPQCAHRRLHSLGPRTGRPDHRRQRAHRRQVHVQFCGAILERPTLIVGSGTGIGHDCAFTVGKKITIGQPLQDRGRRLDVRFVRASVGSAGASRRTCRPLKPK